MTRWLPDILAAVGVLLLATGLGVYSWPLALISTGAVLLAAGVMAGRGEAQQPKGDSNGPPAAV